MKKLLLPLLFIISLHSFGQIYSDVKTKQDNKKLIKFSDNKLLMPLKDSSVYYEDVVNTKDTTSLQTTLYTKAQLWFADAFANTKSVLQIQDKANSRILGIVVTTLPVKFSTRDVYLKYTVELTVKNGKYRYRFYNLYISGGEYLGDNSLTEAYKRYLNNAPVRTLMEGRKAALKRYEDIFILSDAQINRQIADLKYKMSSNRADNF